MVTKINRLSILDGYANVILYLHLSIEKIIIHKLTKRNLLLGGQDMNLVFITNTLNEIGGIERVMSRLSNYFIEKLDYNIHIISVYSTEYSNFFKLNKKINITNLGIKYEEKNSLKSRFLEGIYISKKIQEVLYNEKYDIIMTFHPNISNIILQRKSKFKGKIVVTDHNNHKYYRKRRLILNIVNYRKADKVVVLTQSDKIFYSRFLKSVVKIQNAIPFKNDEYPNYKNKRILSVGRLEKVKGFDYLIDSFSMISDRYPHWSLSIIGQGSQKQMLEEKIKNYNLEGKVAIYPPTKQIENRYLESSIYALSSRFEGFSLVTLEAMECGLPIVSFDIDAAMEILKDSEDSLIAKSFDISEFAENLSLFMDNEERRKSYGEKAKENVQAYNIENIVLKWHTLFQEVLKYK